MTVKAEFGCGEDDLMHYNKLFKVCIALLSLVITFSIGQTNADAKKTYHYIPKAIRGYYTTVTNKEDAALILRKHVFLAYDREDSGVPTYFYVTKVVYSHRKYYVHQYINWNGGVPFPGETIFHQYAKNRLSENRLNNLKRVSIPEFNTYFDQ